MIKILKSIDILNVAKIIKFKFVAIKFEYYSYFHLYLNFMII